MASKGRAEVGRVSTECTLTNGLIRTNHLACKGIEIVPDGINTSPAFSTVNHNGLPSALVYTIYECIMSEIQSVWSRVETTVQALQKVIDTHRRTPSSPPLVANFLDSKPSGTSRSPPSIGSDFNCSRIFCLSFFLSELRRGAATDASEADLGA